MKPKQEADELIEKYSKHSYGDTEYQVINNAIQCALIDNQKTIDALEKVKDYYDKVDEPMSYGLVEELNHHNQVRTILKSRLNNY